MTARTDQPDDDSQRTSGSKKQRRTTKTTGPRQRATTPGRPLSADELHIEPLIEPTWGQLSTLVLADTALSRLLTADSLPVPGELGPAVDEHLAAIRAKMPKVPFVRGDVLRAHGFTTRYLHKWLPADLHFAGRDISQTAKELAEAGSPVARRYQQHRPPGRRLAWAADLDDLSVGLVLDRLHYTHRDDCVADLWMREQAAYDMALGSQIAGAMFAGVRLLAPLTPRSSVHLLPDGRQHSIGDCDWCTGSSPWARSTAQASSTQQPVERDEDAA